MERLDLRTLCVPVEHFDRPRARVDWKTGDKLPVDPVATNWLSALGRRKTLMRRLKVPRQNLCLANTIIVENSIRRFGVRSVLTNQRNTISRTRQLREQRSKSLTKSLVFELTISERAINPRIRPLCIGNSSPLQADTRICRNSF
jgi:hypothetical protein